MDVNQFLLSLLEGLSKLDFVEKVDIQTEVFVLKGRAICFVFERGMDD